MIKTYIRVLRIVVLCGCLVPLIAAVCSRLILGEGINLASGLRGFAPFGCGLMALFVLLCLLLRRFESGIATMGREQSAFLDRLSSRYLDWAIFGSAGVSLFLELSVIRFQTSEFLLFSFYKNLSLLACFAGLGLGYALAKRDRIPLLFVVPLLGFQVGLSLLLKRSLPSDLLWSLRALPITEQLNVGPAVASTVAHHVAIYSFLGAVFLLTALAFLPIGQLCGQLIDRKDKLRAYGLNLLGSLAGVLLMLAICSRWAPPVIWFAIAFGALLVFQTANRKTILLGIAASTTVIAMLAWPISFGVEKIYSPYQLIERVQNARGQMKIRASGFYFQQVYDLSTGNANLASDPELASYAAYYDLPYKVHEKPRDVAIVGAGTGNDVAAALRAGVDHVDAIEIDPAILGLGKRYHPERPYDDPRVRTILNDARSFLRTTDRKYDLIVYGLLDSHTLLSHASSVRLDSFVYTIEGLREARSRLKENGVLCLSFCTVSKQIGRKIYMMMEQAFDGRPPVSIKANYDGAEIFLQAKGTALVVNDALLREAGFTRIDDVYADPSVLADVSTDDWPFFYMPRRVYPVSYLVMLAVIVVLSAGLNGSFIRERPHYSHLGFFLLGGGFMLVETKAITELGLTFGNTWQVIGFVISGVLLMAFLANWAVQSLRLFNPRIPLVLLLLSLAMGLIVAQRGGFSSTFSGRFATLALLTCPMFFAGIAFSTMLRSTTQISGALGMNLVGAMFGGLLEYNAMYFGFQFLYWLAMGLYLLALVSVYVFAPAASGESASPKTEPALTGASPMRA